jgi:hypothetical protein
MRVRELRENSKSPDEPSPFQLLLGREDVTLRLLEEIYEVRRNPWMSDTNSPDARRLRSLDGIQSELRNYLRASVKSPEFAQTKERTLALLDKVAEEQRALQQKEPFNDISDPERSLLIDIMLEIDATRTIARQKALQLASIIKLKHQDLAKLQTENAKAAVWTKWGTAGTIFLAFFQLFYRFSRSITRCSGCEQPICFVAAVWHNPAINRTCAKSRAGRLFPR